MRRVSKAAVLALLAISVACLTLPPTTFTSLLRLAGLSSECPLVRAKMLLIAPPADVRLPS